VAIYATRRLFDVRMARLTRPEPATPGLTGRYSNLLSYNRAWATRGDARAIRGRVARLTGLEPATPGVTGRYSNRLSYNRASPPGSPPERGACNRHPRPPRQARPSRFGQGFSRPKEADCGAREARTPDIIAAGDAGPDQPATRPFCVPLISVLDRRRKAD